MFTFVTLHKSNKPRKVEAFNRKKTRRPSGYQYQTLEQIRRYLNANRCCRRKRVYTHIEQKYGCRVECKRIYAKGGVGSYKWMPMLGCYRLQVGASKISTKKTCFPYADCIEIFDYQI